MSETDIGAPIDVETPVADAQEQGSRPAVEPREIDLEAPEADSVEQSTAVRDRLDEVSEVRERAVPTEADEADVAEQDSVVDYDDDEYR